MAEVSALVGVDRGMRMWRLAGAALATGIVGGIATGGLVVVMTGADVVPAAHALAIVVPVLVTVLIGWRLLASGPAPSTRWIAGVAGLGVLLIMLVQVLAHVDFRPGDGAQVAQAAAAGIAVGSLCGLIAAAGAIVILVPLVLAVRTRIAGPWIRALVTVVVMVGTAVFALPVTGATGSPVLTGMAAALAGVGALLATGEL